VAVSNRLPIEVIHDTEGWHVRSGSGGLVTSLAPVLRDRGGFWIGWPGAQQVSDFRDLLKEASRGSGYTLIPVSLTDQEIHGYYHGFANEIVWPLFHDLFTRCSFRPDYWYAYKSVNEKFARMIARVSEPKDYVWVHDYHLMYVARNLKKMEVPRRLGFFLHIPFPAVDIFLKLPWRSQVLRALLDFDLIGFQTMRDRRNFVQCLQLLHPGVRMSGRGAIVTAALNGREVRVGAFPVGIDFQSFARLAETQTVRELAANIHATHPGQKLVLGIDRLDYTKGIPERLEAFRNALIRYPDLRGHVTLMQVVVPSRAQIPAYQDLKAHIDRLVGEINGQFTRSGWVPIHYLYRSLTREELVAYYLTSEIALITPLKDGMNLVSKEYCACNRQGNGLLILSEFAGAAAQLRKGALLVNPYDVEGVADAVHTAFHMSPGERKSRMVRLRDVVRRSDIFWWVDMFLQAALTKRLVDFPEVEEYLPVIEPEAVLE